MNVVKKNCSAIPTTKEEKQYLSKFRNDLKMGDVILTGVVYVTIQNASGKDRDIFEELYGHFGEYEFVPSNLQVLCTVARNTLSPEEFKKYLEENEIIIEDHYIDRYDIVHNIYRFKDDNHRLSIYYRCDSWLYESNIFYFI